MVQSRHWTDPNGLVFVTRSDGRSFKANPTNIGVESELYTRFGDADSKDTSIEEWFADAIDGPASTMINYLLDPSNIRKIPFRGDPNKKRLVKELGFCTHQYAEFMRLPDSIRGAIARYLAALLVRHPIYLDKLIQFNKWGAVSETIARHRGLDNMLKLFEIYSNKIGQAVIMVSKRAGTAEYLYADGGLMVQEPWRSEQGIPFDIHAPITPDLALEVLPVPTPDDLTIAHVIKARNPGVARQNRILLGGARRFVFSRQSPHSDFISKNFGVSAPKNIGYRFVNGELETKYEPLRR
jgi:hypothetical protein